VWQIASPSAWTCTWSGANRFPQTLQRIVASLMAVYLVGHWHHEAIPGAWVRQGDATISRAHAAPARAVAGWAQPGMMLIGR
jgi:hypothetical protein